MLHYVSHMGKRLVLVLLIGATVSGMIGCGTTHQFIPANPIPRHEWQLSINWHYDFDNGIKGLIVPELSYYRGAGKDWNCGIGFIVPFPISHVSVAKYYNATENNSWLGYLSLNQVLGLNDNPYYELGASYIRHHRTYDEQYGLGLAYGHGYSCMLSMLGELSPEDRNMFHYRLMPVLRYQVSGADVGLSYVHYHGKTSATVTRIKDTLRRRNDTLCVIEAGMADSLKSFERSIWAGRCRGLWGIFLSSGDTVILTGPAIYRSCITPVVPEEAAGEIPWRKYGLKRVTVTQGGRRADSLMFVREGIVSISGLAEKVKRKERIVITEYGPEVRSLFTSWRSFTLDHSVAYSAFAHSRK